jgi:uncharacterized integral membrane protein
MSKILITATITVFLVLFGIRNSDHVLVSFIVGTPTKIRLIFLLAIATIFGFLLSYLRGLANEIRLKKEIRRLNEMTKSALSKLPAIDIKDGLDD